MYLVGLKDLNPQPWNLPKMPLPPSETEQHGAKMMEHTGIKNTTFVALPDTLVFPRWKNWKPTSDFKQSTQNNIL